MTLPVAGNAISMSQINTELGLGATAQISFNDPKVRACACPADSTDTTGPVALSNARGRKAWSFSVSGTAALGGTAPDRNRTIGYAGSAGTISGVYPAWLKYAYLTDYEAASTYSNSWYVQDDDNATNTVTAAKVRALWLNGQVFGQGIVNVAAGDYIYPGWSASPGDDITDPFVVGGTTPIIIFSDG